MGYLNTIGYQSTMGHQNTMGLWVQSRITYPTCPTHENTLDATQNINKGCYEYK